MEPRTGRRTPRITLAPAARVSAAELARELRAAVRGEVRFDAGSRALYAADASNYRQVPVAVLMPEDAEDVVRAIAVCRRHGVPILSRGAGTSLAGQTCNVAVLFDFSKAMNRILELDPASHRARVQPGVVLDHLRDEAERYHLTFGPDPATHQYCTLGGMIGNDSCGMHAQMAGRTSQNVQELEILTYNGLRLRVKDHYDEDELDRLIHDGGRKGEIFARLRELRDRYAALIRERFPDIPRLVSGYGLQFLLPEHGFNLAGALVGSESTLVTVLEATVRLVPSPPVRILVVLGYKDVYVAGDHVPQILKYQPLALEGLDDLLVKLVKDKGMTREEAGLLPPGGGWLVVELGGQTTGEAAAAAEHMMAELRALDDAPSMRCYADPAEQRTLWAIREAGLAATAIPPNAPRTWPGWEDSAVAPAQVGSYLRGLRALFEKYGYHPSLYGHFGQGCIHCSIDFDLVTAEGLRQFRSFLNEAAHLCVAHGGSLSGEHGDGQARGELLPIMFGDELMKAFREFKAIWDPERRMNPGKLIEADPILSNLRLGTHYQPSEPTTHFKFPEDGGSFANAALRCVGVGKCRKLDTGTMCPSYMVTREEKHTTRGRAHALFEMLRGEVLKGGWKDEGVKETLDLCLSCKGCKGDCPVNVDIATYKAEFLSHYYEGRLRPRSAYAMGWIRRWAKLAALAPRLVNALTHAPGLSALLKWGGGIAQERTFPAFAEMTFKRWFRERPPRNVGRQRVILWPDTFNDHFSPHVAQAAVEVLEAAGFQVVVPEADLCCGRPLYDYGFLDEAKARLREILKVLRPLIEEGVPLVALEPSCLAVFRDEMPNLYPHDEDAVRLRAQAFTLAEFLQREAPTWQLPALDRKAIVHGHCHQKAVLGTRADAQLLARLGLESEVLDSGCCGMAGSFGFEAEKRDLSIQIGERVLLPAVRRADPETLILTDGFSCREQIAQQTDRQGLHLAEVIRMALHGGERLPRLRGKRLSALEMGLLAAGVLLVVGGVARRGRAQRR